MNVTIRITSNALEAGRKQVLLLWKVCSLKHVKIKNWRVTLATKSVMHFIRHLLPLWKHSFFSHDMGKVTLNPPHATWASQPCSNNSNFLMTFSSPCWRRSAPFCSSLPTTSTSKPKQKLQNPQLAAVLNSYCFGTVSHGLVMISAVFTLKITKEADRSRIMFTSFLVTNHNRKSSVLTTKWFQRRLCPYLNIELSLFWLLPRSKISDCT